jgi:hypothetical protein
MDSELQFIEKAIDLKPGEELKEFISDVMKAVRKLSIDRSEDDGPVMLHGIFADHVVLRSFGMGGGQFFKCQFERTKDGVKLGNLQAVRMSFTPVKKSEDGAAGDHTDTTGQADSQDGGVEDVVLDLLD